MARTQYSEVVTFIDATTGALKPANNARVSVFLPGTSTPVTIYTTRSAGTTKANPFVTDATGTTEFWAEWGDYDIKYEDLNVPSRFGTRTFGWSSTSGANAAIPIAAEDAVISRQYAPIGAVVGWWRPNNTVGLPTGWVVCDGSTVTSGNHDFGTGASITLPDLRNRFILGANVANTDGQAGTTGDSVGAGPGIRGTGGTNQRNLQHSHTISLEAPGTNASGTHGHTFSGTTANNPNVFDTAQAGSNQKIIGIHTHAFSGSTSSDGSHSHTVNNHSHGGATGNGLTQTDFQPAYVGLLYIMKVKRN